MSVDVIAVQVEALDSPSGEVAAAAMVLEVTTTTPLQPVNVAGAQLEYTFVQPNREIRAHGAQFESLQVELPGPVRVHSSQVEVLHPIPMEQTPAIVTGMTIEVLRTVEGKKRRPPMNVVAN